MDIVGQLADYWVVKTDYSNYAVVYECKEQNPDNTCKTTMSWVLSRHRILSDSLMADISHVIESLCLNETLFYTTTQTCGKHVLVPVIGHNTTTIMIFQTINTNYYTI